MTDTKKEYTSVLNNLIETCKDGEEGFKQAAEGTKSAELREVFNRYSRQRAEFAAELQKEVSNLGDQPEKSGSVTGSLHRGWMNIKTAVTGKDDQAILNEAERGEDSAVSAYKEALTKQMPTQLQSEINRQYRQVQQAHDQIRSLRDGVRNLAGVNR
jgi:uncharacterized protein (TIGR02284 family)